MENPFKKLSKHQKVPKILKERVLNDVGRVKLTLDLTDLFVEKHPETLESVLTIKANKRNN